MEYGVRRYDAAQRLLWFAFFLLCLALAYPIAKVYQLDFFGLSGKPGPFHADSLKSFTFWMQLNWLQTQPFGSFTIYVIWVALLFIAGRIVWLLLQLVGKRLVRNLLVSSLEKREERQKPGAATSSSELEKSFPTVLLYGKVNRLPLQLVFHPYQRLRLMLARTHGTLSSEDLMEKERRIVETDWQILWSSWTPFRWLIWLLPLLGLGHSLWLLYEQVQPALSGQKELQDLLAPILTSILPLAQLTVIAVLFSLVSGLLKRFENLYLSSVDGLFYDQLLSRLPFQSSDTLIILEAMERHFQQIHARLGRLERSSASSVNEETPAARPPQSSSTKPPGV
jgi:hypothetical protein